jgi:hypothetical protein
MSAVLRELQSTREERDVLWRLLQRVSECQGLGISHPQFKGYFFMPQELGKAIKEALGEKETPREELCIVCKKPLTTENAMPWRIAGNPGGRVHNKCKDQIGEEEAAPQEEGA